MNWGMMFVLIGALGSGADGAMTGAILWGFCKIIGFYCNNAAR
jgi:hypothetical protein